MNILDRLEQYCLEHSINIKMTEQRKLIAEVIASSSDHPDVEVIYQRAAKLDPGISLPTVYRTVALLEDIGIIAKHDFKDGRARYEVTSNQPHYHLIDIKSGKVIEFHSQEVDKIKDEIANKLGYKLVDYRLELYCVPLESNEK